MIFQCVHVGLCCIIHALHCRCFYKSRRSLLQIHSSSLQADKREMMLRLSVPWAGLIVFLAAASVHRVASASLFPEGDLACPSGHGEANCTLLPNNDLRCSVDRNGTRCDVGANNNGLTYCTIRWRVNLAEGGGVDSVSFVAYRETLDVSRVYLLNRQGRLLYDCDNVPPTQSVVTTRCHTASCCESAEFTIPSICLYRRRLPPKPTCYRCVGFFQCNPGDASCKLPADTVAACSTPSNLYYSSGCSFTVLLMKTGDVLYYADNEAILGEEDNGLCVASSYSTEDRFMAITCKCRGDTCNSGIRFKGTELSKFSQLLTISPGD